MLNGQSVLVTGGTGSFGHAFVRRALQDNPRRLVIFSRDEQKQEQMERLFNHPSLRFFIGDVRDRARLELAMRGVDIVVHAAAMKIVPTCERDPEECIKTNVLGAMNVAQAAMAAGVQQVIALSTDKACNPINLYGATKLAAEKYFVAFNEITLGSPSIACVRYGNVIASRGSVIPFFRQRVASGLPLPITDARMTRFWITLEQAVEFVLSSLNMMTGGEIFVPKLPSMAVTDLTEALAPGYPAVFVGIRPGEKIHETLLTEDEARNTQAAGDRYIVRSTPSPAPCVGAYTSGTARRLTVQELRALISTDTDLPDHRRVA